MCNEISFRVLTIPTLRNLYKVCHPPPYMPIILTALGALILVIIIVVALYVLFHAAKYLAINAIVGLIILAILKWLGIISRMHIGLWDVIITAIGGVVGVLIILILYFLGYDI